MVVVVEEEEEEAEGVMEEEEMEAAAAAATLSTHRHHNQLGEHKRLRIPFPTSASAGTECNFSDHLSPATSGR